MEKTQNIQNQYKIFSFNLQQENIEKIGWFE